MKQIKKVLAIVLALATLLTVFVAPVSAVSYRTNASGAGASSSYKNGKYYKHLQNITLTGDKRTDVIAVALSQLGYQESAVSSNISGESGGSGNYTEFMTHVYGSNQAWAWCAAFCAWSLHQAQATDHVGANKFYRNHIGQSGYHWCEISCPYWKQALQFDGLYKNSAYNGGSYTPKTGDLIFFKSAGATVVGHIGLVVYTAGGYVYTIEGNTSSGTGLEANGGGVYFKRYALTSSNIDGYGALDYPSSSDGNDIDYSGANPTTGLYITAAYKYLYANESCTTRATYSNGGYVDIPQYTMVEVIGVSADKTALKVTYNGVTGYLHNNSTDRVIQLTSTSGGNGGGNTGGETPGGNTGGTTTGGVHQLQGVGVPSTIVYKHGIDISYYQVGGSSLAYNMIDFAKLKAAGCEFVILRAGDSALSGYIDPSFIQLYKNAKAAGMDVGVYYFSRATTYAGSQAEAEWLISIMKQNNMQFEYPIYIDIETSAQGSLSAAAADQLCLGWCETLEKAGYYPGIYSGTYVMFDKISTAVTNYYDLWIASYATVDAAGPHWDYNTKDMASKGYTMWQYSCFNLNSSNNYVYTQGIYTSTAQTTPVRDLDLDVCYKDYPTIMKTYGYNGFASNVETRPESIVAGKDYTTSGTAGDPYYANLTDGVAGGGDTTNGWCGWSSDGSVTFDLGENYNITGISVHLMNLASYGIGAPLLYIEVSDDGVNYTTYSKYVPFQTEDGAYWANLDLDGIFDGRYVRVKFSRYNGAWIFMNEIEIYGEKRDTDNLALGGNYTTSSNGDKHSTDLWQDDEVRLTDGIKNHIDIGETAYSGWQATKVEVIVDLGRVKETGTYSVYTASGNWGISAMKNVTVSVSTDGKTYTTVYAPSVYEVTGTGNNSVELAKFTVSAAETYDARYVKFTLEGTGSFIWLDEVEVTAEVSGSEVTYENLLSGLTHSSTTGTLEGALTNKTDLTDGVALPYGKGTWFGLRSSSLDATNANTVNDSADFIYDLGGVYDISGARIHLMNLTGSGICAPKSIKVWVSLDGVNYYKSATLETDSTNNTCYWASADNIDGMIGRYVKITIDMNADKSNGGGGWVMLNEIEVYGEKTTAPNGTINGVTYVVDGDNVIFTVVTTPDYNSVKVTTADNLYSHIDYASSTAVDANGNTIYTLTVPAVVGTTKYAFDGRLSVTNLYENEFYYVDVTVEAPVEPEPPVDDTELYKSVSYEIKDDKIIFTVVTAAGDYNRIKVANANALGTSLGVGTYTVDENGNYVWTVKASAPTATTTYAFDLRTSEMKYLKDYYTFDVEYVDTEIFKSVSYEIENGKIVFTVVTLAGDYNRVKVTTADALSGSLAVSNTYTVDANGNYVWVVKTDAPTTTTTFAFDLRTTANKYLKDYYMFDVEYVDEVIFKSTSYEVVDGKVIFTAVTKAGDYNRVKISLLDNITSYVKYVDTYTINADGDYVWTLKFNAPTAVTEYALDIRVASTMRYVKDYYYVSVDPTVAEPEPETVFVSGSGVIADGKLTFTIVTLPTTVNRVKVMLTSDQSTYVKLIDKYTVDANGNYVWTATVAAPSETTSYTLDVRSSATGRYVKDFFTFDVVVDNKVEVFKSVSYEIVDGKIVFTVVTTAGNYDRIKLANAATPKTSIAVGSYTVNADGDYVWTVKTTAPTASASYAFDLRIADALTYVKDYYYFDVAI